MSLTVLIALLVVGAIALFLYRNPQLLGKAERSARIGSDKVLDGMTTAIQREKDAVRQIAAKIPAQRERVAKNQARVDRAQREYDAAVKNRDGLKTKFETLQGRVTKEAGDKIAQDYAAAKKTVADLEASLTEAKQVAGESERTVNEFESELKKAAANITTDEGRADLAAAYRETAALRNDVKDLNNGLSAVGEARKEIENELDVARHLDQNSQGSATDREIKDAEKQLEAEQARKELEADLSKDKTPKTDSK